MDKLKAHSDIHLIELLKREELSAFEEIYRRHWKRLYSLCYKRVQSREVSEEIVQDIFTNLWVNRITINIRSLPAYLATAVKYKVINYKAREMSRQQVSTDNLINVQDDNSYEEAQLLEELHEALRREVDKLPAKRQMIFKLHRNQNMSVKQVANLMGISEKTVENQYGKAMKMLRVNLKNLTLFINLAAILLIG
jgi:RNA polymerase sigma-70 factor (family 1)